ncbi:MAG: GNAT family N-acetyltransferase [Halieaceae bacterium]|nr:GNAT family N-acetyltransferase [Halieaceae bacterium]
MHIREGSQSERDSYFMMGFDAWHEGRTEQQFLEALQPVERYDRGTWYVLQGESGPVAVLIVYRSGLGLPRGCWGIGSVATALEHRRQGFAGTLIQHVIDLARAESARGIYLFSGVDTAYYARFGFACVQAPQPQDQAPCMVLALEDREELMKAVPEFF